MTPTEIGSDWSLRSRIAIFVDIENLINGASTLGLPLDLGPIVESLKEFGRVQVRRCFGDISQCLKGMNKTDQVEPIRKMLHRHLFQIEDVPYLTEHKNTADIHLVVDALSLAFREPNLDCFVVVSSDRDYVPLFNKLRELGRMVVAIGIDPEETSPMVRDAADRVYYYRNLVSAPAVTPEEDKEARAFQVKKDIDLLLRALNSLGARDHPIVATSVNQQMRALRSDWEPRNLYGSFKNFIMDEGLKTLIDVEEPVGQGDIKIGLKPETAPPARVVETKARPQDPAIIAKFYRETLQTKLKSPLPSEKERQQIYSALDRAFNDLIKAGPFDLEMWKMKAIENLVSSPAARAGDRENRVVFKMLLTLYFAGCFYWDHRSEKMNPVIEGRAADPDTWEEKWARNMIRNLQQARPLDHLDAQALCFLFYGEMNPEKDSALFQERLRRIQDYLED